MNQLEQFREQCLSLVSSLDCAHRCGVGHEIADKIRALPLPESNAGPCEAMHIGFDYLDNGQLVATYALPVRAEVAPKLYTSLTDWDALRKENEKLKESLRYVIEQIEGWQIFATGCEQEDTEEMKLAKERAK